MVIAMLALSRRKAGLNCCYKKPILPMFMLHLLIRVIRDREIRVIEG
jgi:hypothetical protein